jgi:hypothetical protein
MSKQRSVFYMAVPGWLNDDLVNLSPHLSSLWKSDFSFFETNVDMDCLVCDERIVAPAPVCFGPIGHASHFWSLYAPIWQRGDSRKAIDYHALAHTPIPTSLPLVERLDLPQRRGFSTMVFQMVCGVYLALLRLRWSMGRGSR